MGSEMCIRDRYIPENNDFIVHTKMLGGGESDTINFKIEYLITNITEIARHICDHFVPLTNTNIHS